MAGKERTRQDSPRSYSSENAPRLDVPLVCEVKPELPDGILVRRAGSIANGWTGLRGSLTTTLTLRLPGLPLSGILSGDSVFVVDFRIPWEGEAVENVVALYGRDGEGELGDSGFFEGPGSRPAMKRGGSQDAAVLKSGGSRWWLWFKSSCKLPVMASRKGGGPEREIVSARSDRRHRSTGNPVCHCGEP